MIDIRQGDCVELMRAMTANSVDSIVTDPPYELGFMGKSWDSTGIANSVRMWDEALRVLKPGGYLLAFGGSRTYHRMACAIEDAGFEIRDQIMWVYGSGFPKSLDVSKAIDKAAGAEREVIGSKSGGLSASQNKKNFEQGKRAKLYEKENTEIPITAPSTQEAQQWAGWGTALKPAHEPIVMARKPLSESTVASNVLKHGTGGINIDVSRIEYADETDGGDWNRFINQQSNKTIRARLDKNNDPLLTGRVDNGKQSGRWPANFIHDGSDEVLELFPDTKGVVRQPTGKKILNPETGWNNNKMSDTTVRGFADSGSASRFFYCAKASKKDRNEGLDGFEAKERGLPNQGMQNMDGGRERLRQNHHPTVKPTDLMRYLIRLVTPPNGTVLDPFTGSGSTGKAAVLEGFNFIGCELDPDYIAIAEARINHALKQQQGKLL